MAEDANTHHIWIWCAECRGHPEFHTPDTIHCVRCGRILGKTTRPVERDLVHLARDFRIRSTEGDTGVLAEVEWDDERIIQHVGERRN